MYSPQLQAFIDVQEKPSDFQLSRAQAESLALLMDGVRVVTHTKTQRIAGTVFGKEGLSEISRWYFM